MGNNESVEKLKKVVALTQAIERARADLAHSPSPKATLHIQHLLAQRRELQALLRPHVVTPGDRP